MFRTSLLRTASTVAARRAVVPAARTFVSRPAAAALRVNAKTVAPVAWKVGSVRAYSAAGGLSKEDVEGRIVGLLAGFDKVSLLLSVLRMEVVGCLRAVVLDAIGEEWSCFGSREGVGGLLGRMRYHQEEHCDRLGGTMACPFDEY